jgi:hypothetical protein
MNDRLTPEQERQLPNRLAIEDALLMASQIRDLRGHKCNDRELEFLDSLELWRGDTISEKMSLWLNAIYDRVMR